MKKRLLSILLCVCMVATMMPTMRFTADATGDLGTNFEYGTEAYWKEKNNLTDITYTTLQVGQTLTSNTYYIRGTQTLQAASVGANGLNIASGANVTLILVDNAELICSGADASTSTSLTSGGGAGIYLPYGSKLTFKGTGTVTAAGGAGTAGSSTRRQSDSRAYYGAQGGKGQGAGIGTNGAAVHGDVDGSSGSDGSNGHPGYSSAASGQLYVQGNVKVIASGSNGYSGSSGYYSGGGGGGGGGYAIGAGGFSGGGGGSTHNGSYIDGGGGGGGAGGGGGGGQDYSGSAFGGGPGYYGGNAGALYGGYGGAGNIYGNASGGTRGGDAGSGGYSGTYGSHGSSYVAVKPQVSGARTGSIYTYYPADECELVVTGTHKYKGSDIIPTVKVTHIPTGTVLPDTAYKAKVTTTGENTNVSNTASVTVTGTGNSGGSLSNGANGNGSLTKTFAIEKADLAASFLNYTAPSNLTYTGTAKVAEVSENANITGTGDLTVHYYSDIDCKNELEAKNVINPATYYVGVTAPGGANFTDSAKETPVYMGNFTIIKKTPTVEATAKVDEIQTDNSTWEDTISYAVTVTGAAEGAVPTGTVQVMLSNDTVSAAVALVNGAATVPVTVKLPFEIGSNSLSVVYTPDSEGATYYNGANSSERNTVVKKKIKQFTVTGNNQIYSPDTERKITITNSGTTLNNENFTVTYYRVNENENKLYSTSSVPQTIEYGKYLYVITLKSSDERDYYAIDKTFSVSNTALPNLADYTNVGYMFIRPSGDVEQQKPIFFQTGVVNKLTTDTSYTNTLTNENIGAVTTYASSDSSIAEVNTSNGVVTIKRAGSVTITATSTKDLTPTTPVYATYTLTISKAPVTVTVKNETVTYGDPTPYLNTDQVTFSPAISEDYSGTPTFSGYTAGKAADTYEITAKGLTSDKYVFTYVPGTLTVNTKPLGTQDLTFSAENKEYDGTKAVSATVTVNSNSLVGGDRVGVDFNAAFVDSAVGSSTIVNFTNLALTGGKAANYNLTVTTGATQARISQMPITFSFGTSDFPYDGTTKPVAVSATDSSNRVFRDFTVTYGNSKTPPSDQGTYIVTATPNSDNYSTRNNTTTLNISKGNVFVWAADGVSQKYNGEAKTITPMSVPTVPTDVTYYAITTDGKVGKTVTEPTEVGSYLYVISQSDENYEIAGQVSVSKGDEVNTLTGKNFGVMEILENAQGNLVFETPICSQTYGDDSFVNKITSQETDADITYTSSNTAVADVNKNTGEITIVKPGTAIITATSKKTGYADTSTQFAVQVAKKTVSITIHPESIVTYKGNEWVVPYEVTDDVVGNSIAVNDITFTYTDTNDYNKHTPRDVGTYLASAHVRTDNVYYTSNEATGYLQIDPAELTVTANDKTIIYGDEPTNSGLTYTTLLGTDFGNPGVLGGTLECAYSYAQFGDVGKYTITPSGLTSDNYNITFEDGSLTVEPKEVTVQWTDPASLVYTSTEIVPDCAVTNAVNEDALGVTVTLNNSSDGKSVGTHSFTATALTGEKAGNYKLPATAPTNSITITPAAPTLTLSNWSAANTGNPIPTNPAKVTGLGTDGDMTGTYTVTYTYYTDSACTTKTTTAEGAISDGGAPSKSGVYYVKAEIPAQGNYAAAETSAPLDIYVPSSGGGGGSVIYNYTLSFNVNGGSDVERLSKSSGTTISLSDYTSTKDGYTFAGWYSDADLTTAITSVKLTENTTIYAKWTENVAEDMPLVDVPDDAYYKEAVKWAYDKGITGGTSETTFSPDDNCARAQVVTFLWRAMGKPVTTGGNFSDVDKDAYYADAVAWAVANGITSGIGDNLFSPDETVTRGQFVTFLWRAAGSPAMTGTSSFTDVDPNTYYAQAIIWAEQQGITQGTGDHTFGANADCTRAQIVTFLWRLLGK